MGLGHFGMGYGMGWIGMWIYPILIFAFIIFIIYIILGRKPDRRSFGGVEQNHNFTGSSESALDLLKKRYAKGEITKEEFEQVKKDIL